MVLTEEEGERRIPIIIGGVEAQSIAIKLEGLEPPRPLTHDLFLNFAKSFNIKVTEVIIYKLEEGIFYSELICTGNHNTVKIDSRTSDAVALALRFNCPIFTYEEILLKAGIVLDFGDTKEPAPKQRATSKQAGSQLASKTAEELKKMLDDAVDSENYEKASEIRNEMKRRENKQEKG